MSASFPQKLKLRKRAEFLRIAREGRRFYGTALRIDWIKGSSEETRLGITASRRYGDAVTRNRFKRLVREAFRASRSEIPRGFEVNVVPLKDAKTASFSSLRLELISLISRCS